MSEPSCAWGTRLGGAPGPGGASLSECPLILMDGREHPCFFDSNSRGFAPLAWRAADLCLRWPLGAARRLRQTCLPLGRFLTFARSMRRTTGTFAVVPIRYSGFLRCAALRPVLRAGPAGVDLRGPHRSTATLSRRNLGAAGNRRLAADRGTTRQELAFCTSMHSKSPASGACTHRNSAWKKRSAPTPARPRTPNSCVARRNDMLGPVEACINTLLSRPTG